MNFIDPGSYFSNYFLLELVMALNKLLLIFRSKVFQDFLFGCQFYSDLKFVKLVWLFILGIIRFNVNFMILDTLSLCFFHL